MAQIMDGATWDVGVLLPEFAALQRSLQADVVIIGGGITGLTAAYLLSSQGREVVLIEKNRLGSGATGATTAFLSSYLDTDLTTLVAMLGKEKTRLALASHSAAIAEVEKIVREESIDCEFERCANYMYANTESDRPGLQREQAVAEQLGSTLPWQEKDGLPFTQAGALKLEQQAKFHPRKYLAGLVKILQQRGVHIFEQTEARAIEENDHVRVHTSHGTVTARHVLVATYAPFNKKLFFKKAFYSSYVYELAVPAGTLPAAMYEDTGTPYHYWRMDAGKEQDRVIIGGEDHRSDLRVSPDKSFAALAEYIARLFSSLDYRVVRRWRGPILEPADGLAFIGPVDSERVFYATGFSGNGMTYGTLAAMLFVDFVTGNENPWQKLYAAERHLTLRSLLYKGRDYTRELWGGAVRNTFSFW